MNNQHIIKISDYILDNYGKIKSDKDICYFRDNILFEKTKRLNEIDLIIDLDDCNLPLGLLREIFGQLIIKHKFSESNKFKFISNNDYAKVADVYLCIVEAELKTFSKTFMTGI